MGAIADGRLIQQRPTHSVWMTSVRQLAVTGCLSMAGMLAPIAAAWLIRILGDTNGRYELLSVGTLTALSVGLLAGIKRGGLAGLIVVPAAGFIIGVVDLRIFVNLLTKFEWSLDSAVMVPTWGLLFGSLIAVFQRRLDSKLITVVVVTSMDLLSRTAWSFCVEAGIHGKIIGDYRWLVESFFFYAPTSAVVVLLMPHHSQQSTGQPRQ